ncbi:MAG: hcaA1 [Hyphomonadaceae bacterium]|nr:MAG: hcaA1 [Hyphomonadaceae bacterium]
MNEAQDTPSLIKPRFKKLHIDEIPEGGAIGVEFWRGEQCDELVRVIICKEESKVYAWVNRCPHAGWPLENIDGNFLFTEAGDIICSGHGAVFGVTDGRCWGGPGRGLPLSAFPFRQVGDNIVIGEVD